MTEAGDTPLQRFLRAMPVDAEKWRDGTGHDLAALAQASAEERVAIEAALLRCQPRTWREIEALTALGTPAAQAALRESLQAPDLTLRLAVARQAPDLVDQDQRTRLLVEALESAEFYGGLAQALDQVADWHPPAVEAALWRGLTGRSGEVAVHFAAMLAWIHGQAASQFDWDQRPLFLRFHTDDVAERRRAADALSVRFRNVSY